MGYGPGGKFLDRNELSRDLVVGRAPRAFDERGHQDRLGMAVKVKIIDLVQGIFQGLGSKVTHGLLYLIFGERGPIRTDCPLSISGLQGDLEQ